MSEDGCRSTLVLAHASGWCCSRRLDELDHSGLARRDTVSGPDSDLAGRQVAERHCASLGWTCLRSHLGYRHPCAGWTVAVSNSAVFGRNAVSRIYHHRRKIQNHDATNENSGKALQQRLAAESGEGGIRTLGGCDPTLDFESSTIGHSVTSPRWRGTRLTESPVSGRDNKQVRHLCQASRKPRSDFRRSSSHGAETMRPSGRLSRNSWP